MAFHPLAPVLFIGSFLSTFGVLLRGSTSNKGNASSSTSNCKLPDFGRWCTVQPSFGNGNAFAMAVYSHDDIVSNTICSSGSWETSDVSDLGTPGTALDIGGNVGYYSFLMASRGWHVETFEPLPMNLELIKATACRNPELAKKIKVHEVGLGAHDDNCVFISGYDNVGDGWVRCGEDAKKMRAHQEPIPSGYALRGDFPVKRLDEILAQSDAPKKIDFVKLDVEGYECQVFNGGDSLLKKFRPKHIQSEVWPTMDHCLPANYLNMFAKANYKVAKTRHCDVQDASLTGNIQDFFMCRRGALLLQLQ